MCVIIYKPAGKELPSLDILDKAYRRNPHGCGIVSPNSVIQRSVLYFIQEELKKMQQRRTSIDSFQIRHTW